MVKAKKEAVLAGGGERECASLVDKLKEAESAIAKRTEALGPSFVRVNDPAQIMVGNAIERASLKVREGGADISLLNQRVGDVGMISMAEALMGNATVTWLDISGCDVGPKGISALVPWIGKSWALQTLWLASNPSLGDQGCVALAAGLKTNTVLAKLDLTNCNVGAQGCTAVVKALQANPSLRELRLALNNFGTLHRVLMCVSMCVSLLVTATVAARPAPKSLFLNDISLVSCTRCGILLQPHRPFVCPPPPIPLNVSRHLCLCRR